MIYDKVEERLRFTLCDTIFVQPIFAKVHGNSLQDICEQIFLFVFAEAFYLFRVKYTFFLFYGMLLSNIPQFAVIHVSIQYFLHDPNARTMCKHTAF